MIEIRINVTQDRLDMLTVEEMVAVEDVGAGKINLRLLRDVVAKFIVDDQGVYCAPADAFRVINHLLRPQFHEVVKEFFAAVNSTAVNPTTDGN